jgi:D-glycero-beta-D-manno-heptose 1-phosphate adenylyltransferase
MGQIVTRTELPRLVDEVRRAGCRIVFTNGVFDLLHVGHLRYLRAARALGDLLIVGVNDDASTARLKGPARPLVPQEERAELLAALEPVGLVVLFDEDTAAALVAVIQPDVYVKGGDYAAAPGVAGKPLTEAALVHAYGGEVQVIPLETGCSTTNLVERIVARYRPH